MNTDRMAVADAFLTQYKRLRHTEWGDAFEAFAEDAHLTGEDKAMVRRTVEAALRSRKP